MNAVVGCEEVVDLNNNSGDLDALNGQPNLQRESFATSEKQEGPVATLEEQESVSNLKKIGADFSIPLSIFHYKGYGSDFFTSWYNISSEIFKEINRACLEKKVLNSALSVLMFPYVASVALGLVIYKTNSKTQTSSEESKTKKSEVSTAKRLAYGVLAAIAILVDIAVLIALIIPATPALATFYLTNRKLSHSLVAALKISNGLYQNEYQNIEVSFREIDAGKSDIKWDMEVKFPPQFEQLLRDLYEDKDGSWFNVARDSEHNTILKLSANINLKNGLRPLRNEIKNVLAISIQEFAKTMEELMKLEGKDITYDKLKELLDEFRLKVVDSVDSKLVNYLIQNAYRVAFIQAIKFQRDRRGEDFSLEDELRNTLVKQKLESQGKELPNEKEMIIEDLKNVGIEVPSDSKDDEFSVHEAEWKELKEKGKIVERKAIDIYKNDHPQATEKALDNAKEEIERLRGIGQIRYNNRHKELKEIHGNSSLTDGTLKRRLEDLFKFEYDDQEVEHRLIKSVIKKAQSELSQSGIPDKEKQSLRKQLEDLEKKVKVLSDKEASAKINDFIEEAYLEIKKYKVQRLLKEQKEGVLNLCGTLKRYDESDLAEIIEAFRVQDEKHLEESKLEQTLKDQNERLQAKQREKGHPITKSIKVLLERNKAILEALKQLELKKEGLLINEETKNNYREELESREKIKFAIIEDKLLEALKEENFDEAKIKELLEKAELEYCLAEKCIKYPVIKTKDNIKHFCQNLLSPLINRLVNLVISNVPKDNQNIAQKAWNSLQVGLGYIRLGLSATVINKNGNVEGKALSVAHDTHKEIETFLQHFESSYEEVGALIGDVFSDDGETFKDDVWPKIEEHLHGMWNRFFKDIEFKIGNRLDEVSVTQQNQETVITF
ncbi:coiled-coil domain-containing protein [Wolbachia endosymbiont (group A) of Sphaerophoria taeniata]|uniref:hypothetical protein n=1 Tax=Wolbachia endosymbiont (group A) of Sphaerophoria taeniata TaxID=2954057 RepID=UPI0022280A09|nr:hypothetical protein [Wolbachia endosymbiont (group A) of Sphaerophoria taeniata]